MSRDLTKPLSMYLIPPISGATITAPMLDVKTVAAGGGSILFWRGKLFVVGPEVCSYSHHPMLII
jgi:N-methylhydantoinase A/oxoprolinase/acetone carboxylase beta subunit